MDETRKKELAFELADAIEQINMAVAAVSSAEHIEVIHATIEQIRREQGRYEALGIMFHPFAAEGKKKVAEQAISRLEAVAAWAQAMEDAMDGNLQILMARNKEEYLRKMLGG